ncbi:glucosamine-6-phosphate deaminase [Sporolactobacillus sp. THM7-4]|nr:glucosamine-6-phosphate deaminase [Sporolactobacillus sp. THM7-4]
MNVISVKDEKEMSQIAAEKIIRLVHEKPDAVLGLATGGTPEGTYHALVADYQAGGTSYRKVRTVNLDEYVGLDPEHPNSYHTYMQEQLFNHIDIPEDQHFLPDGTAASLEYECRRYDKMIDSLGGIDLQLLGIGENGHIGFNEPGTPFDSGTHVVTLTPSTRHANARFFGKPEDVPERALTMGIGTILKSKSILLIVSGEKKADALYFLLNDPEQTVRFPASALLTHPDVTLIADRAAMSGLPLKGRNY